MTDPLVLRLKKNCERRLRGGHLWVYANELEATIPLSELPAGADCVLLDANNKPLGRALLSPHSLICARIYSRNVEQEFSRSFVKKRLHEALQWRQSLYSDDCYRLVYGETDGLPGLVVDRFGDTLVVQTGTVGMEQRLDMLVDMLVAVTGVGHVVIKNDATVRAQEGLDTYTRAAVGEMPERVQLTENGCNFYAPLAGGQKTGWFYDHREARARMHALSKEKRVLDVFSYCGAWGVGAAVAGATQVTCVDASQTAIDQVLENAELNGVGAVVDGIKGDAKKVLKTLIAAGEKYDVVVLDPPAFIKRKKDFRQGLKGYHQMNELALRLVKPGGVLVSASCSMHLPAAALLDVLQSSARHIDRRLQVTGFVGQAADHPIHPAIPETSYLKSWFVRVLMNV